MKINYAYRTLAALSVCVVTLSGCKKSETPAASGSATTTKIAFNAACPIQPDHGVSYKAPTVEYKDMTIGFCCSDCPETWNGWPESTKDEFIAKEKKAIEADAPPADLPETPDH